MLSKYFRSTSACNHLVCKIEGAFDFTFIYELVKELYYRDRTPKY